MGPAGRVAARSLTTGLPDDELPAGFLYPPLFLRMLENELIELQPWQVLQGEALVWRHRGLRTRYPERVLVPFARRCDNDDVACWEGRGVRVVVVHDFASPGWERREELESFADWLRSALDDFIDWE